MPAIDMLDIAAFAWFAVVTLGYQFATSRGALHEASITRAVNRQRLAWMRGLAARENRAPDAILQAALSSGNAFFASTSAIAIGGLASLVGSGDRTDAFLSRLPFVTRGSPLLWEIKIGLLLAIFVYAFFEFAWAFRLTHYTAIMIGAMPNPGTVAPEIFERQAAATGAVSGFAAEHSNSGLRSFYYAVAALAWFFGPLPFLAVTTFVGLIFIRRDFFSRSRRAIVDAAGL